MSSKKILITGVTGFIGKHVARHFKALNWEVIGIGTSSPENAPEALLIDYHHLVLPHQNFIEILKEHQPDLLVHCAGRSSVPFSMKAPEQDYQHGPSLTFFILEQMRLHSKNTKFVFLSSAAVYGNPENNPIEETHPLSPISPYGYHKWQSEIICKEFFEVYKIPTTILRVFSAYGAGLRRQVIWDICFKITFVEHFMLHGTGTESRDFIHALDIAQAIECITNKSPFEGDTYNIASGQETSIKNLANNLVTALGSSKKITFNQSSPKGMPINWKADITKLLNLGFNPTLPISKGLDSFANWFLADHSLK